jgi:hypothetical protein
MKLLTRGNSKLGEAIHAWSLPPVTTCPGRSALCERHCYARKGKFLTRDVKARYERNYQTAMSPYFVRIMSAEIRRRRCAIVRVHVSGDFYSPEYVRKWMAISLWFRNTRFYAYTRSWRVPDMLESLSDLGGLRNWRLWYSADAETGMPVGGGARVAWMATRADETVPAGVGLVFRVRALRSDPVRRIGLSMVCPTETGLPSCTDVTCTSCGRCFDGP